MQPTQNRRDDRNPPPARSANQGQRVYGEHLMPRLERSNADIAILVDEGLKKLDVAAPSANDERFYLGMALECMVRNGLSSVREIRKVLPDYFPVQINNSMHVMTAQALELLAWYQHRVNTGSFDIAVQFLERASMLTPGNERLVERLSNLTIEMTTDHVMGLDDKPRMRDDVFVGYKRRVANVIGEMLKLNYGMTADVIYDQVPSTAIKDLNTKQRNRVYRHLGNKAELEYQAAEIYLGNENFDSAIKHFHNTAAVFFTQLQLLRYPRSTFEIVDYIHGKLNQGDTILDNHEQVIDLLGRICNLFHVRAENLRDYGEDAIRARALDVLLNRLNPQKSKQI